MRAITGRFHQNQLETARGVVETRLTTEKLLKGHNSGKNQSSITSIIYAHLQVMSTISGKFHKNPLKTVGVAETRTSVGKNWLKLTKGHNSGKKRSSVTSV